MRILLLEQQQQHQGNYLDHYQLQPYYENFSMPSNMMRGYSIVDREFFDARTSSMRRSLNREVPPIVNYDVEMAKLEQMLK
jgi:hypothetical protein